MQYVNVQSIKPCKVLKSVLLKDKDSCGQCCCCWLPASAWEVKVLTTAPKRSSFVVLYVLASVGQKNILLAITQMTTLCHVSRGLENNFQIGLCLPAAQPANSQSEAFFFSWMSLYASEISAHIISITGLCKTTEELDIYIHIYMWICLVVSS